MFPRKDSGTDLAGIKDCFKKQYCPHCKLGTQRLASATRGQSVRLPSSSPGKRSVQLRSPEAQRSYGSIYVCWYHVPRLCVSTPLPCSLDYLQGRGGPYTERLLQKHSNQRESSTSPFSRGSSCTPLPPPFPPAPSLGQIWGAQATWMTGPSALH